MRRLPAFAVSCSIATRSVQLLVRAGAAAMLLAAVAFAVAAGPAAAENLPAAIPDVDEGAHVAPVDETFVIARVFACPTAETDQGSCESLAGVTLAVVLDGEALAGGPPETVPNPIGSNSADFMASASQWLSIAVIDGLPEGYAPAAGYDPFMALVSDLPFQGCGGESLCQYADLIVVPTGAGDPVPSDPVDPSGPSDPQPVPTPADEVAAPAGDDADDPAPSAAPAPTAPNTAGTGGGAVTALPNTGAGPTGSPAVTANAVWMLMAIGIAGLMGRMIVRGMSDRR